MLTVVGFCCGSLRGTWSNTVWFNPAGWVDVDTAAAAPTIKHAPSALTLQRPECTLVYHWLCFTIIPIITGASSWKKLELYFVPVAAATDYTSSHFVDDQWCIYGGGGGALGHGPFGLFFYLFRMLLVAPLHGSMVN